MAHKKIGDNVVVDWETGDPEGDRRNLFNAYRDFINEVKSTAINHTYTLGGTELILELFDKWQISTENKIDDFPRIWIKRP